MEIILPGSSRRTPATSLRVHDRLTNNTPFLHVRVKKEVESESARMRPRAATTVVNWWQALRPTPYPSRSHPNHPCNKPRGPCPSLQPHHRGTPLTPSLLRLSLGQLHLYAPYLGCTIRLPSNHLGRHILAALRLATLCDRDWMD